MTYVLRKNCCDPPCPSDVEPCDDCGDEPPCEYGYWFYGINPVQTFDWSTYTYITTWRLSDYDHGYMAGENDWGTPVPDPDDVADSANNWSWMDRVWLAKIVCSSAIEQENYDEWGNPTGTIDRLYGSQFEYLNHHDLGPGNLVGPLDWDQSPCYYESTELNPSNPAGTYILRGEDSVNGKAFKPQGTIGDPSFNGTFTLQNEPTAPTLILPDGTIRYSIQSFTLYPTDGSSYTRTVFGDTTFLDTNDTTLTSSGYVNMQIANTNILGHTLEVPSWLTKSLTANIINVLPAYVTGTNVTWSNQLEEIGSGFTCATDNEYDV